jgi:hypothetical protein
MNEIGRPETRVRATFVQSSSLVFSTMAQPWRKMSSSLRTRR